MELKKANLHMDQIKCQANVQITLEEDKNISDRDPDAAGILMEKGRAVVEEVRPGKDSVSVKGKLLYDVLYISEEEEGRICHIQGEIPWEEKIRAEGMDTLDRPAVKVIIEDLRSGLINSRKINIRALLNCCTEAKEIQDEEILVEILDPKNMEIKKEPYSQSVMTVDKNDIFRIKEDLELPGTLPPIQEVLWKYLDLEKWEIATLEDKIGIQGELNLFILYETEGEGQNIRSYETKIPFSGNLECPGCSADMTADITPVVSSWNINVKPDYDGEERLLDVEMVLDIPMQLYEDREMDVITDIYGTGQKINVEYTTGWGKRYGDRMQARIKMAETINIPKNAGKIVQICHIETAPVIESSELESGGLTVEGMVCVSVLYMTRSTQKPYEMLKREIPFSYTLDTIPLTADSQWKINAMVEQCHGILLDEDKMEIKMTVVLDILPSDCWKNSWIKNVRQEPFAGDEQEEFPGIMVYIPGSREELWEIGKKYSISQASIKNINQLTKAEAEKGQKILLVKDLS